MAVRYLQGGNDDLAPGLNTPIDDDSLGWWAGVRLCAVSVAIASTMAITALATDLAQVNANLPQDELPNVAEELYWQNPVRPVPATMYVQLPFDDPEEIPAGSLFGQYDEDFWENPVSPVAATLIYPQPWFDDSFLPQVAASPIQDEDFWENPISPVQASLYQQLPYSFDDVLWLPPAPAPQPDEDFWQNPVEPVAASMYQQLPYWFDAAEPGGLVNANPDEDYWINWTRPVPQSFWLQASLWMWQEDSNLCVTPPIAPPATGRSARLGMSFSSFR